jgi:maltoporin
MKARRHIEVVICVGVASLISASRFSWAQSAAPASGDEPAAGAPVSTPAPHAAPTAPDGAVPKGERGLAAEGTSREPGSPPPATETATGFDFGSYGRIGLGMDGRGHEGYSTNVVSHGSRLEEAPYLELDFYYSRSVGGDPHKRWRVVVTPAFAGDPFHYTGDFTSHFALRNAYAETQNVGLDGLSLWAGSRMYRGDDIYLFDYWPLDNLNTVGAGARYERGKFDVALHAGMNLLDSLYQYETLDTPPRGLGPATQSIVLDRPRFVSSLKLEQRFGDFPGMKVALYGELHLLPAGTSTDPTTMLQQALPSDVGWVAGAELSTWLRPYVFANLWFRAAGGLAAYGELTAPTGLDPTRSVSGARELLTALSVNWESKLFGVMGGAYVRRFTDASTAAFNPNSYTEGIISARPHIYWTEYFHTAVEVSYQARRADGLDFVANRQLTPQVFRFSALPIVAPMGRGTYSRPQIYLIYTLSVMNDDARAALFDPSDYRYGQNIVHYIGTGVEWWFNSSYR